MKRLLSLFLLISVLSIHPLFSQDSKAVRDVSALLDQYALARNEMEAEKTASFLSSDPFFKYNYDGFSTTKKEWIKYQSEAWARMSNYSFRWKEKKIKILGKNSAVATCISSLTFRIKGGPWGPGTTVCTITLQKADDDWLITSFNESTYDLENKLPN